MDSLTKKILENARKRKEKQNEIISNINKENEENFQQKLKENNLNNGNKINKYINTSSLPSVKERIESILNYSKNDSRNDRSKNDCCKNDCCKNDSKIDVKNNNIVNNNISENILTCNNMENNGNILENVSDFGSTESLKKEPEAKIRKEIPVNHENTPIKNEKIASTGKTFGNIGKVPGNVASPSKLLNSPFIKFNIVSDNIKNSPEKSIAPQKKNDTVDDIKTTIKEVNTDPKIDHNNVDRHNQNSNIVDIHQTSVKNNETTIIDNKIKNAPSISSFSSISEEYNVYIPQYPKISEESGSTIGSSMLVEEEIINKQNLPKPIEVNEINEHIKEIPNPSSFPSTPNTPKMIVVEEKSNDQLKTAKPNEYGKLNVMPSASELIPSHIKKNQSTKSHAVSSSVSSLTSLEGCILHDTKVYEDTLASIKRNISENQSIIHQTSQALHIAYIQNKNKTFLSKEMIEAERLSLLAYQKRKFYIELEEKVVSRVLPCKCSNNKQNCNYSVDLTLKDFSLFIKTDYFNNFDADIGVFHFCFVISHDSKIFTTNAVSINDIDKNILKFSGIFSFTNIESTDFVRIQLFVLTHFNEGQRPSNVFQKLKIGKKDTVPRNSKFSKKQSVVTPVGHDSISPINTSNFLYIGEVNCPVDKSGLLKLSLLNIVYDCPITGSFTLNSDSKHIDHCMAKGFLTSYVSCGNSVAWQRYWCGLFKDYLNMWSYPQDETTKNPIRKIKLRWPEDTNCIRSVPIEECSRKDTFEIKIIEPNSNTAKGFVDFSYLFAADSADEKKKWIDSFVIHIKKFSPLKNSTQQNIIQ